MLVARLATKKAKPNGQYYVTADEIMNFMAGQKIQDIPGMCHLLFCSSSLRAQEFLEWTYRPVMTSIYLQESVTMEKRNSKFLKSKRVNNCGHYQ